MRKTNIVNVHDCSIYNSGIAPFREYSRLDRLIRSVKITDDHEIVNIRQLLRLLVVNP